MDACAFQQFNTCICNGSLDASSSNKTFNGDMLNVDVVVPHHRKIHRACGWEQWGNYGKL